MQLGESTCQRSFAADPPELRLETTDLFFDAKDLNPGPLNCPPSFFELSYKAFASMMIAEVPLSAAVDSALGSRSRPTHVQFELPC